MKVVGIPRAILCPGMKYEYMVVKVDRKPTSHLFLSIEFDRT